MMSHEHIVDYPDNRYTIDGGTKEVRPASTESTRLVQGDKNSHRITIEAPRSIMGHDLSHCNVAEIHFTNTSRLEKGKVSKDIYSITDLHAEDDKVVCTWLVGGSATVYAGPLSFTVKFKCVSDGEVVYELNTMPYDGISVAPGGDNGEVVVEHGADLIAQFSARLAAMEANMGNMGGGSTTGAVIGKSKITLYAEAWQGNESPFYQVVDIKVPANSKVDLQPSDEQQAIFEAKKLAFLAINDGGTVTVKAYGQKPENTYTIQCTITEVKEWE